MNLIEEEEEEDNDEGFILYTPHKRVMEIISEIEKNWKLTFTENRTYSPLFYKFSFILYSISPK